MYECRACGTTYSFDGPWQCDCGHALDFADPPGPEADGPPDCLDRAQALDAFRDFLPADDLVGLGEGWTPLVQDEDVDATYKLEYLSPTGSFKDRGAAVTVSLAAAHGVERVVEDSSGNAGLAIATYAARAGIDATIYVPADAAPAKLRAMEATGARVVRVEGDRRAVTDACVAALDDESPGWYASHAWRPSFYAGTATFACELAAQRGWNVPEAVVCPVGNGTLLLGAYRGFRALRDAGWIDRTPRLYAVQAGGVTPIVDALAERSDNATDGGSNVPDNDLASGIQVERPARLSQVVDAVATSGGTAVAVGPAETADARADLARSGFLVEATSATALAGLRRLRVRGDLAAESDVVLPLTGANEGR